MVVGVDKLFKIINWDDCIIVVLFGDGVGVVVMGLVFDDYGLFLFDLGLDGLGGKYLNLDENKKIYMNGCEVFCFVVC